MPEGSASHCPRASAWRSSAGCRCPSPCPAQACPSCPLWGFGCPWAARLVAQLTGLAAAHQGSLVDLCTGPAASLKVRLPAKCSALVSDE